MEEVELKNPKNDFWAYRAQKADLRSETWREAGSTLEPYAIKKVWRLELSWPS